MTRFFDSFFLICLLALFHFRLIRSASILKIRTVENGRCVDESTSSSSSSPSRRVKEGDYVYLDYEASIDASSTAGVVGHVFDSSYVRKKPWGVVVTSKHMNMVQGLFEGLLDMCEGEKRVITIPPELGFGDAGALPNIPGGATLRYEVVCVSIRGGATKSELLPAGNVWSEIDVDGDWRCTREELDAWFAKTNTGQTKAPEGLFAADDVNGDGIIEWHEFRGPKGKKGPSGWNGDEIEDKAPLNPIHPPPSPAPGPVIITSNVMARQDDEPQCFKDGIQEPCFVENDEDESREGQQEVEQAAGNREYTREPPFAKTSFERNKQPTMVPLL